MAEFGHELATLGPWLHHYGVAAVFVILTLESLGMPLPGESLLVVAAALAGRGDISLPGLIFSAWAGSVIGDNIGYLGGRMLGRGLLRRYGGKIGLTADRLNRVETVFARYGPMTVVFARFFNVLRQLNGVIAGTMKMDWRRFLVFNALGGALWVSAWIAAGFCLASYGMNIAVLMHKTGLLGAFACLVALIAGVVYVYGRRFFARRRRRAASRTKGL
jgi:membrane protein DedA with SNARE-associated domain